MVRVFGSNARGAGANAATSVTHAAGRGAEPT